MTTTTAAEQIFLLPDLGEGLTEAEVVRWLVAEGDPVAVDQPVVEVETAKSVVEVPSPYGGVVARLHAAEGESVAVGSPLITVRGPDSRGRDTPPLPEAAVVTDRPEAATYREEERAGSGNVLIGYGTPDGAATPGRRRRPRRTGSAPAPAATPAPAAPAGSARPPVASPQVRRLARDGGIDLAEVSATGPDGLVTRHDVVRALAAREDVSAAAPANRAAPDAAADGAAPAAAAAPALAAREDVSAAAPAAPEAAAAAAPAGAGERRTPLSGFRRAAAAQLTRSRTEIPEATVWVDVDATPLWELRESTRTPADPGPGLLAYLARFVVAGLRKYPVLNARIDVARGEIVEPDHVHLGIAVQGERGLVVPAVLDAHTKTVDELDAALRDVTARAREGRASAAELSAGTFTLNNYGAFRVDGSAAIINHPQVAILGVGRILERPWVVDGAVVPRRITQLSFVFDHRVCDGGTAAGFLRVVADAMEDPAAALRHL